MRVAGHERENPNQVNARRGAAAQAVGMVDRGDPIGRSKHVATVLCCALAGVTTAVGAQPAESLPTPSVVVTATRHPMPFIDAPASMSVVTREQIEQRGADNVLQALLGESGITLQGRTIGGRRGLSVRGMDGRHVLTLVNGKRISASDGVIGHSDFQYDWIPIEGIERIEVIRGPMSVLYGSEALGGVINVILRQPGDVWAGSALLEGRQAIDARGGDGQRVAARVAGPLGPQWRLGVTLSDVRLESVASEAEPLISEIEDRQKRDALVQLAWLPTEGQLVEAEYWVGMEERWATSRERGGRKRYYDTQTDIDRGHASLGWAARWGGALELSSLLRVYESSLDTSNTRSNGVAALRPQKLVDRVIEGQATLAATRQQLVTGGFERRDETLHNDGLPGGWADALHQALYVQDEIAIDPTLALTLGLRYDRQDLFGGEWSPRIYAVWNPAPQWTVKGGYGHGFKAPTLKQISPDYREDEGPNTYFGNADVQPETNDSVELGVGWSTPQASAMLTLFHNQVDNLIVARLFDTVAGRGQYLFENIDQATLRGAEASLRGVLGGGFWTTLNYQYLTAIDGNGQRLEKRPRHSLGARLDWAWGPWTAGLLLTSTYGQLLASAVPGQPPQQVPTLTLLGAQAQWQITPVVELGVGVDNLSDMRLSDKSPLFTYAEPPRTWRLALRTRW
jgi:outer membrane receptor for ferrienterochelin and colicins